MTITVEQLQYAIEEDQTEYPQFTKVVETKWGSYNDVPANGVGWGDINAEDFTVVINGELLEAKCVATTGGMDEGSSASSTWKIGDQYFRKNGYYASHYGYDWDGELEEVRPVEKVVTVFE